MNRADILEQARSLVGADGSVRDYACDCEPGGERFIVEWRGRDGPPCCYNLDELRAAIDAV